MDVVITSIFPPTTGAVKLAEGLSRDCGGRLWVVGDRKSPSTYDLEGATFLGIEAQGSDGSRLAAKLPENCYSRKNLGYVAAIWAGARFVVETDDDNIPLDSFWEKRIERFAAREVNVDGWYNVYKDFSDVVIWPRGYPLEEIRVEHSTGMHDAGLIEGESLVVQGLADGDPDVDAIFRLTRDLPVTFEDGPPVRLQEGCWCPFNSQNTTFFRSAFPLLYLPSYCSFRMTDIWRSFVAQRCLWAMGSTLAFTRATMFQERNNHSLLRDFEQEIPGYLANEKIRAVLEAIDLQPGREAETVSNNLVSCYRALVAADILPEKELPLIDIWCDDILSVL